MRRVPMTVAVGTLVVCMLTLVGCRGMTGRSFGTQWDDKWISTQVKTKLVTERAGNMFSTGVGTQFGIVRLTGTVETPQQKADAERAAASVAGVRGVVNEILVVGNRGEAAAASPPTLATTSAAPTVTPPNRVAAAPPAHPVPVVTPSTPSVPAPAASAPAASTATTQTAATSAPATGSATTGAVAAPLALTGEITAVNPSSGDVTIKTSNGDVLLRFPAAAARRLQQGQQITINASAK
jgi:hyperosmotically inducible periplasmic protein